MLLEIDFGQKFEELSVQAT